MPNFFQSKRLEIFIIVTIIALIGIIYAFTQPTGSPRPINQIQNP